VSKPLKPWIGEKIPMGFFSLKENKRLYFDWIAVLEGFDSMESWYGMRRIDFQKYPGSSMIGNHYAGSPRKAICDIYSDYDWKPWKFVHSPPNFWKNDENCREYLAWLGNELGFNDFDDWYQLDQRTLQANYGAGMHRRFNGSPLQIMRYFYPENDWLEFRFSMAPKGYWDSHENLLRYMEWLGSVLGIEEMEDWYKITRNDFVNNHGNAPLTYYKGSPSAVIDAAFPEYDWHPWRFTMSPLNTWNNREVFVRYMDWIGNKLEYTKPEDWYSVQGKDFEYGQGMLLHYGGSPSKAVMDYILDYDWKEWLFEKARSNFWRDSDNQIKYLDWLGDLLGFTKPEDWYNVSQADFIRNHGIGIQVHTGSVFHAVMSAYPEFNWEVEKFYPDKKSQQRLFKIVKEIYPSETIHFDFKHHDLRFESSNRPMELDIWIPNLSLAFEYQGIQHYAPFWDGRNEGTNRELDEVKRRDEEKRIACKKAGIKLIEIPYTWNASKEYVVNVLSESIE
jgi:hypothetical protein